MSQNYLLSKWPDQNGIKTKRIEVYGARIGAAAQHGENKTAKHMHITI